MLNAARRVLGAAVAWTGAQHLSYFASAWVVTALAGVSAFGALGQALALGLIGSLAITLRLDYAAQLAPRAALAESLFRLASQCSSVFGAAAAVLALAAWRWCDAPAWVAAGALAVAALALLQVRTARLVRQGRLGAAAALRSAPPLAMLPLQAVFAGLPNPSAVVWSVPCAAWLVLAALTVARLPRGAGPGPALGMRRIVRLLRARWPFVRAEWPSLMLNTFANHGQVLLVGALADDAAAGVMGLALRLAMLPTSLLGPALADALRSRVVAARSRASARALVRRALPPMAGVSALVHALAFALLPWLCSLFFAAHGPELARATQWLLLLGALRLAISPATFLLAWRGWVALNLAGQSGLFLAALASVAWGLPRGGVPGVAFAYALAAAGIYAAYLWASLRALRGDN